MCFWVRVRVRGIFKHEKRRFLHSLGLKELKIPEEMGKTLKNANSAKFHNQINCQTIIFVVLYHNITLLITSRPKKLKIQN